MAETETTGDPTSPLVSARSPSHSRRIWTVVTLLTLLLLLALLPPLVNLGRYQRRIAQSISLSLGRPVHLDRVTLNLLPLPSLAIENFTVEEDPGFGEEPSLHANLVTANLRVSSLWRRRIEISRMRFLEPSVNLVLRSDGQWNLQKVLAQAAHIDTAPTAQRNAGSAPRFPYIEATGARLNLKLGLVKTPFSLTEADFALWLPEPQQWRMRLKAKPVRTDISVSDTGVVEAEATLRREASHAPLSVDLTWRKAPLGDTSRILFGRDLGLRGTMEFSAKAEGSLAESSLLWRLDLPGLHRADFVPADSMRLTINCGARATMAFHTLNDLHCAPADPDSRSAGLALTGSVPDLLHPESASLEFAAARLPAAVLLDWLRVLSPRLPSQVTAQGSLSAALSHEAGSPLANWSGEMVVDAPALVDARHDDSTLTLSTASVAVSPKATLQAASQGSFHTRHLPRSVRGAAASSGTSRARPAVIGSQLVLEPVTLPLGGLAPAVLEGHIDLAGYRLHLTGPVARAQLDALLQCLPPLADGLIEILPRTRSDVPVRLDLTASRAWDGPQIWVDNLAHPPAPPRHLAGRRR